MKGITLSPLEGYLWNAHEQKSTLAIRRLEWDVRVNEEKQKEKKALDRLQDFTDDALTREYSLSQYFSVGKESNETFFCSQLVAAAYKSMGVIPMSKKSHNFVPGSFAAKSNLPLIGAKLGGISADAAYPAVFWADFLWF